MKNKYMAAIDEAQKRKDAPQFEVGDTVDVHQRILEGEKERIQVFSGTVIKRKGSGSQETFIVRRIVQGEGVERIYLVHSPKISKIEVKKSGKTRRAKLYYLRKRVGKATKLREREQRKPAASANGTAAAKKGEPAAT